MSKSCKKNKSAQIIIAIVSIIAVIAIAAVIGFVFDSNKSELAQQQITSDIETFKSNNISAINQTIFSEPAIPEGFDEFVEPSAEKQNVGLMADLISLAEIEIVFCKGSSAILSVEAPDMSGFGQAILTDFDSAVSEDELKKLILEYAQTSEKIKSKVTVDYIVQDEEVSINYNTEEFLNAITGNFTSGYADVYKEYIMALSQEVSDND